MSGPTWLAAAVANNPPVIDSSLRKLMDTFNAELPADQQDKRVVFAQENANGRVWNTLKTAQLPFGVTWTYDGGYIVAGSDRASAERAIATRNGGSPLVWSPTFLGQLPSSAGIHPSGVRVGEREGGARDAGGRWRRTRRVTKLLAERDPVLVILTASRNKSTPPAVLVYQE